MITFSNTLEYDEYNSETRTLERGMKATVFYVLCNMVNVVCKLILKVGQLRSEGQEKYSQNHMVLFANFKMNNR